MEQPVFKGAKTKLFNGVGFKNHPRGRRVGNFGAALPGLKKAVHIDGTLNNDTDRDRGWTAEVAFPWKSPRWLAAEGCSMLPKNGDVWRMDFTRFNSYKEALPAKDSGGWFWTRHGARDSHIPERFVRVTFTTEIAQNN